MALNGLFEKNYSMLLLILSYIHLFLVADLHLLSAFRRKECEDKNKARFD